MIDMSRRIIFVLGMSRSGTSALTRVLSLCGATLPTGMVGAAKTNPKGFWEPRKAVHLNEVILKRHGSSLQDPTLRFQEGCIRHRDACAAKIVSYLAALPDAPIVVIKDLQITVLADLWFDAAREAGYSPAAVIAVRHPQEVTGSLHEMTARISPELAAAWWIKYSLLAERNTRDVPRVFVDYGNLLGDWRRELKRISAALSVDMTLPDDGVVEAFLDQELRHHNKDTTPVRIFGTGWIPAVYDVLSAAARDEPWSMEILNRVFASYRASESTFRRARDNSRMYERMGRIVPPGLSRLGVEALALAHGRRGTWA